MITHKIKIDTKQRDYIPNSFTAVVNDDRTRVLNIDLDYDIPSNARVFVVFKKPNEKNSIREINNSNPLAVTLTSDILNQSGQYLAEIKVVTEDSQITSSIFRFSIRNELKKELTDDEKNDIEEIYKETIRLQKELNEVLGEVGSLENVIEEVETLKLDSVFSIRGVDVIE